MTEQTEQRATPGTAAHYDEFLTWAASKGELPQATVKNWRVATFKVLDIEDNPNELDLVGMDLPGFFGRFETLNRMQYSKGSLQAYKSRFNTSVETYRRWLSNEPDWKPRPGGQTTTATKPGPRQKRPQSSPSQAAVAHDAPPASVEVQQPSGRAAAAVNMIEYPLPVRRGIRARLVLPDDLTPAEARRVATFVASLAFEDEQDRDE